MCGHRVSSPLREAQSSCFEWIVAVATEAHAPPALELASIRGPGKNIVHKGLRADRFLLIVLSNDRFNRRWVLRGVRRASARQGKADKV
jgi:hypothetical protein